MLRTWERFFNAIWIIVITIPVLAAWGVQYFQSEEPCSLCFMQRLCMISVAIGPMLNLKFGTQVAHYGLALLSSLTGASISIRQFLLHVCPGSSMYGIPVMGLSLYTWAFIVFGCSILAAALLLFFYDPYASGEKKPLNGLDKLAYALLFIVTAGNIAVAYALCGLGPC